MLNEMVEAQAASERVTIDRGLDAYREKIIKDVERGGFDKHAEVQKLIRGAVPLVSSGLQKWLEAAKAAKGRKSAAVKALAELDLDIVAAIGITSIFHELADEGRVARITKDIGKRVEIELEAAALSEEDPKAAKRLLKLAEGSLSKAAVERRFRDMVTDKEVNLDWTDTTRVLVGQAVLNVALQELEEVFSVRTVPFKNKTQVIIELSEAGCEALVEMEDDAALQHLPLLPMVAQPRPWDHFNAGAYYDYRLSRLVPLVRTHSKEHRKLIKEALANGTMQEVIDALNAIQDTRWAIDTRVLEVIQWVREQGLEPGSKFPKSRVPDSLPKVAPEEWEKMTPAARTARSRKRRSIRDMRQAIGVSNKMFREDLETADWLAAHECFYLPHSLDFRGRTYAVPYFNHQRSDHLKALFRFADAVPLGETGGKWLMIHLANCGDFGKVSKKPFEDRVQWVRDHEEMILQTASLPEETFEWWSQADSPFCFLQACFEFEEWARTNYSPDFLSSIPGAADGSCSGLQHYSAITRSEEEAYHVNLLPRDDVGDIYQVTADQAIPTLQTAANQGDIPAQVILKNGFGRSEVKRNVMTYFYGSAKFGMRDQHMQDLMRPLADQVALGELEEHPYSLLTQRVDKNTGEVTEAWDGGYSCAATMAGHVYAAVTSVAAKADEASKWIQTVASTLSHEGKSMIWNAPTGMPVVQRYSEWTSKYVNLWLYDRSIRVPSGTDRLGPDGTVLSRVRVLMRQSPTTRIDKKTMRNASSPNVIHSMDAAHLHRSVALAKRAGIEHFSLIHDSFGTHLGNMELFGAVIREAFVSCYRDYCPLEEIERQARLVLSEEGQEKIPPRPERGNLDLEQIREALFAFA